MEIEAEVSTTVVTDLSPETEYSLTVYAVSPGLIGDSATIIVQTSGSWTFKNMQFLLCINCSPEHEGVVFQHLCLRLQISVSLRRVCSLCVWAGCLRQAKSLVSRSSSQNVCSHYNLTSFMLSSIKEKRNICKSCFGLFFFKKNIFVLQLTGQDLLLRNCFLETPPHMLLRILRRTGSTLSVFLLCTPKDQVNWFR